MHRAFLAVVPPPEVLDAVESLVESARSPHDGLRWARRDQWHLTLQFLGPVSDVDSLGESLGESLRRRAPVGVQLGGGGAFPSPSRGSIVWVGFARGGEELARLAAAVTSATRPLGFPAETRRYHPHVTLARAARARKLAATVAALGGGTVGPAWTVERAVLMESDTRPEGAVYRERASFELRGGAALDGA